MGFPVPRMSSPNHLQTLSPESDASPAPAGGHEHEPSLNERLVDMNLEALNCLWEGSGDTAVTVLRAAVDLLLSTRGNNSSNNSSNNTGAPTSSTTSCPPPLALRVSLSALELLPGVLGEEEENKSMDHDGFCFYRHVFSLEYDDDDDDDDNDDNDDNEDDNDDSDSNVQDSEDTIMMTSDEPSTSHSLEELDLATLGGIFLYNMGVISHEVAVVQADLTALAQAQSLYRSALSLFLSSPSSWSVDRVRILLALYTNLGHAATFIQDRVTLTACYNGMNKLLGESSVWLPRPTPCSSCSSSSSSATEDGNSLPAWADVFVQSLNRAHSYQLRYATAA